MAKRIKYSAEFKREAVQMVRTSDGSASRIARELGINPNMPGRWCRAAQADGPKAFQAQGKAHDEEMAALKRELVPVKKERGFLEEAAAFFVKASK